MTPTTRTTTMTVENTNTENQHKNDAMPHDKQQLPIAANDKDFMTNHSFTTLSQREPTKPAVTVCQTIRCMLIQFWHRTLHHMELTLPKTMTKSFKNFTYRLMLLINNVIMLNANCKTMDCFCLSRRNGRRRNLGQKWTLPLTSPLIMAFQTCFSPSTTNNFQISSQMKWSPTFHLFHLVCHIEWQHQIRSLRNYQIFCGYLNQFGSSILLHSIALCNLT